METPHPAPSMRLRATCEFLGTFWLVLGGCGAAVLAAAPPGNVGIGPLGVSLAFGLSVLTAAYAVAHISGAHFNPAVTIGLFVSGRLDRRDILPYVVAQVLGAIVAAVVIYFIASGRAGFTASAGFAANGYGAHSPAGYGLGSAMLAELVLTFMFMFVILGVTDLRAAKGFAPLAIGLALALIHFIGIPVTNVSVNPARSTGPALFAGGWAIAQLWMFWLVPIAGAALAAYVYRRVVEARPAEDIGRGASRDTGWRSRRDEEVDRSHDIH